MKKEELKEILGKLKSYHLLALQRIIQEEEETKRQAKDPHFKEFIKALTEEFPREVGLSQEEIEAYIKEFQYRGSLLNALHNHLSRDHNYANLVTEQLTTKAYRDWRDRELRSAIEMSKNMIQHIEKQLAENKATEDSLLEEERKLYSYFKKTGKYVTESDERTILEIGKQLVAKHLLKELVGVGLLDETEYEKGFATLKENINRRTLSNLLKRLGK